MDVIGFEIGIKCDVKLANVLTYISWHGIILDTVEVWFPVVEK